MINFEQIDQEFLAICQSGDKESLAHLEKRASLHGIWLDFLAGLIASARANQKEMFDYCLERAVLPPRMQQPFNALLQRMCTTGRSEYVSALFKNEKPKYLHMAPAIHAGHPDSILWMWDAQSSNQAKQDVLGFLFMFCQFNQEAIRWLDFLESHPDVQKKPSSIFIQNTSVLLPLALSLKSHDVLSWFLKNPHIQPHLPVVAPEPCVLIQSDEKVYQDLFENGKIDPNRFLSSKWIDAALDERGFVFLHWLLAKNSMAFTFATDTPQNKERVQEFLQEYPEHIETLMTSLPSTSGIPWLDLETLKHEVSIKSSKKLYKKI